MEKHKHTYFIKEEGSSSFLICTSCGEKKQIEIEEKQKQKEEFITRVNILNE